MKYNQNNRVLTNRNGSVKTRVTLLDAIVSPSLLFGLIALRISETDLKSIAICQRKMLRKIIGWVRYENE